MPLAEHKDLRETHMYQPRRRSGGVGRSERGRGERDGVRGGKRREKGEEGEGWGVG